MSLESMLQLLSCISETQKKMVRLAAPPHLPVCIILRVIAPESAGVCRLCYMLQETADIYSV